MRPGRGSGNTVQVVASGGDLFGFADAGTMAVAVSKGAPVVMVANVTQRGPIGVITLGRKLGSPKELEGKIVGLVPGEAPQVAMLAVMKRHGIPDTAIRTVAVEAAVKVAALLTKKVDVIPGFSFGDYLRAQAQNPDVQIALFSDWGVNLLGNGYLVARSTLEQKPALVYGFLRATLRGWTDAIADPQAGIDAFMAAFPESNRQFITAGLPMVIDHMHSAGSSATPTSPPSRASGGMKVTARPGPITETWWSNRPTVSPLTIRLVYCHSKSCRDRTAARATLGRGDCQVVEAETRIRQAGASPRSSPAVRQPALCL